jgi:magnesium chelatase subunit I
MEDLTKRAVQRVFGSYFEVADLEDIVTAFDLGNLAETGSEVRASAYPAIIQKVDGLTAAVRRLTDDPRPEVMASAAEFVLEGLHLNRRLNCDRTPLGYRYSR